MNIDKTTEDKYIKGKELYDHYYNWCQDGLKSYISMTKFGMILKNERKMEYKNVKGHYVRSFWHLFLLNIE